MSGPIPGAQCDTCNHPQSAEINAMIEEGVLSGAKIGAIFGLPKDAVSRHVYRRHPGVTLREGTRWKQANATPVTREMKRQQNGEASEAVTEVEKLVVLRQQLEDDMKMRPRSDTARELRQVNQRIAEIRGEARPKQVSVADVEGLPEQIARWFEALEPYPEAREAMRAATDPSLLPDKVRDAQT